jgi:hypothetical protein
MLLALSGFANSSVVAIDVRSEEPPAFMQRHQELNMESVFDIYTAHRDGTLLLIESVECLTLARETAYHLSVLFPDESFVYCERDEPAVALDSKLAAALEFLGNNRSSLPLPC